MQIKYQKIFSFTLDGNLTEQLTRWSVSSQNE